MCCQSSRCHFRHGRGESQARAGKTLRDQQGQRVAWRCRHQHFSWRSLQQHGDCFQVESWPECIPGSGNSHWTANGQEENSGSIHRIQTVLDRLMAQEQGFWRELSWRGARGMHNNPVANEATFRAQNWRETRRKICGGQSKREIVATDGDAQSAEGVALVMQKLLSNQRVERKADPIHLGQSVIRQTTSSTFSQRKKTMFPGNKKRGTKGAAATTGTGSGRQEPCHLQHHVARLRWQHRTD